MAVTRRILIVDDDEHTRTLLRDFCEQSNFVASVAPDGEQIVAKLDQFRPDLVLLDLVMPNKDGFAVLKEIRDQSEWAELPVVILTAVGDMDGKIRGMELGADDFITKPFKLVDLKTRVSSALTIREYRKKLTAAEEALAQLRAVDPVTGAGTYAQLKASVDSEIVRARRYARPAAALVLGIDDYQELRYRLACWYKKNGLGSRAIAHLKTIVNDERARIAVDVCAALCGELERIVGGPAQHDEQHERRSGGQRHVKLPSDRPS